MILNRRNAFLGWIAWNVAKRMMRRKAREVVPAVDEKKRPNKPAIVALLAVLGLGAWFARNYVDDGEDDSSLDAA